jgi:hypothetical protein
LRFAGFFAPEGVRIRDFFSYSSLFAGIPRAFEGIRQSHHATIASENGRNIPFFHLLRRHPIVAWLCNDRQLEGIAPSLPPGGTGFVAESASIFGVPPAMRETNRKRLPRKVAATSMIHSPCVETRLMPHSETIAVVRESAGVRRSGLGSGAHGRARRTHWIVRPLYILVQ